MFGFSSFMSTVLLVSSICYVIGKPPGLMSELSQEQIDKCMNEAGTTEDEMKAMMKDPKAKPEKALCVMKCFAEEAGEISKDGKLNVDFIKSHMSPQAKGDADGTVISCLEAIDVISTCQDIEKLHKCFPHPMKN